MRDWSAPSPALHARARPVRGSCDIRPESADAQIDGRWVARPLARNGGYQAASYARPGLISCADRDFGSHVIRDQHAQLRSSMRGLRKEGFHGVYVLNGVEEIEAAVFERERLWNGARDVHGPFDIAGDVHGCFDELCRLLSELGYEVNDTATDARHVGGLPRDLVGRGPVRRCISQASCQVRRSTS